MTYTNHEEGRTVFEDPIKCDFRHCFAGMGVAGMRNCALGGNWRDPKCPKFVDEEAKLKEWEERAK